MSALSSGLVVDGHEASQERRLGSSRLQEDRYMLVLTRKLFQKLYIGKDICVTVVRLEGGQVRLGIEAPREDPVWRAELLLGISEEAISAVGAHPIRVGSEGLRTLPCLVHGIGIRRRAPFR